MVRQKTFFRVLLSIALITGVIAVLPAAAQEADWLVTSERGTVGISSPAAAETVSGEVEIMGTATSPAFSYYKVEYSVDGSAWVTVDEDWQHEVEVTNDVLATWDATGFKDGAHWLRAVVVDNTGNYVASDPIEVMVSNPVVEAEVVAEAVAEPEVEEVAEPEVEEVVEPEAEEAAEAAVEPEAEVEEAALAPVAAPSWLVTGERGTVGISSPAAAETVSGEVEIMGTATSPAFSYYKVEYSVDGSAWVTVDEDWQHEVEVTNDALATWDATGVKNGGYWLRAVVVDNTGNYVASDPIEVMVSNPVVEAEVAAEAVAEPEVEEVAEPEAEEAAEPEAEVEEVVAEEAAPAPAAAPSWLVTGERGTVGISSPAAGETVSGEVEIMGTATSPAFSYYKVEYSVDGSAWVTVDEDWQHEAGVTNDVLATWDATGVKNGGYWLRAVVVDNTGNYVASDPIKVTVENPVIED